MQERATASQLTPEDIRRALGGDVALVNRLVRQLSPLIQARVARALTRRSRAAGNRDVRQEVENLTQEVFLRLFAAESRTLNAWDPARGSLETFVRWVADKELITILRVAKKNPWTEEPLPEHDLDERAGPDQGPEAEADSREFLHAVIDRVRSKTTALGRTVFDLLVLDGRPAEEVCILMEMSPEAVYAWRSRLGRLAREVRSEMLSEPRLQPRS